MNAFDRWVAFWGKVIDFVFFGIIGPLFITAVVVGLVAVIILLVFTIYGAIA